MNGLPCQDAELKAEKYGEKNPLKTLEKLGCEKYASKYGITGNQFLHRQAIFSQCGL
jgi:hypothetical protein